MRALRIALESRKPLRLLCLGAHSDDIDIGCGATVLQLLREYPGAQVDWVVFSAWDARAKEARKSVRRFLRGAGTHTLRLHAYRDGYFPHDGAALKDEFERLKVEVQPDLIFTHCRQDRHQDHRQINELTWNTWRDHLILEYEIPKYDADLGQPNVFVPVPLALARRKVRILLESFTSQRGKQWFDEETFLGLMRLRGLEANSPTKYAEAFHAPKVLLG